MTLGPSADGYRPDSTGKTCDHVFGPPSLWYTRRPSIPSAAQHVAPERDSDESFFEMSQFHTTADRSGDYGASEDADDVSQEEPLFESALHKMQWAKCATLGRSLIDVFQ